MAQAGDGPLTQRPTGRTEIRNGALRCSPTESEPPRGRPGNRLALVAFCSRGVTAEDQRPPRRRRPFAVPFPIQRNAAVRSGARRRSSAHRRAVEVRTWLSTTGPATRRAGSSSPCRPRVTRATRRCCGENLWDQYVLCLPAIRMISRGSDRGRDWRDLSPHFGCRREESSFG